MYAYQAIRLLKDQKKIARRSWPKGQFVTLHPGYSQIPLSDVTARILDLPRNLHVAVRPYLQRFDLADLTLSKYMMPTEDTLAEDWIQVALAPHAHNHVSFREVATFSEEVDPDFYVFSVSSFKDVDDAKIHHIRSEAMFSVLQQAINNPDGSITIPRDAVNDITCLLTKEYNELDPHYKETIKKIKKQYDW